MFRNDTKITTTALTTTSYTVEGREFATGGFTTYYKIQAVSGDETRTSPGYSNEVSANTLSHGTEEEMKGKRIFVEQVALTIDNNYPNPFNPTTTITYSLPNDGFVTLKVYDMLGREVAELVSSQKFAGKYSVQFDASKFSSGMYVYKLSSDKFTAVKKMMLVK